MSAKLTNVEERTRFRWRHVAALCAAFLALPVSAIAAVHWPDLAPVLIPAGWLALFGSGVVLVN